MLVPNQKIIVKWTSSNVKRYKEKGYTFTKFGEQLEVNAEDLPPTCKAKVQVQCDECLDIYEMLYAHYTETISKKGKIICRKCSPKHPTKEVVEQRQSRMFLICIDFCNSHGYTLLTKKEELRNNESEVRYICPVHGECIVKYDSVRHGNQCYKCSRAQALKNKNKTTLPRRQDLLYSRALKVSEDQGYELISKKEDIINNRTYITYKCPHHGLKEMRIANYNNYKGCPDCAIENLNVLFRLDSDEVEKRIENLGGKLHNKEKYINTAKENLIIDCPYCGKPFTTSLRLFCQHGGQACPNCRNTESIGEKKIRMYLEEHKIIFEQEKWFTDCRDVNPLPFDFYLPKSNQIIEFDGKQHFDSSSLFYHTPLSEQKSHDEIKNKYCKDNNIKLLRIPYWEINNINNILDNSLCT